MKETCELFKAINIQPDADFKDIKFFYESAKRIVNGGFLFGKKINIENPDEIIASLFVMLLDEQRRNKELQAELGFMMD